MKILQLASLDVLIVGIVQTVAGKVEQTGCLVDCEAKTEDIRLGQLAGVHVLHLQELWGHVPAVSLLWTDLATVDGSYVAQVPNLVMDLVKVSRTALVAAPGRKILPGVTRTEVTRGCSRVCRLMVGLVHTGG